MRIIVALLIFKAALAIPQQLGQAAPNAQPPAAPQQPNAGQAPQQPNAGQAPQQPTGNGNEGRPPLQRQNAMSGLSDDESEGTGPSVEEIRRQIRQELRNINRENRRNNRANRGNGQGKDKGKPAIPAEEAQSQHHVIDMPEEESGFNAASQHDAVASAAAESAASHGGLSASGEHAGSTSTDHVAIPVHEG